jgi:hypothetical protein
MEHKQFPVPNSGQVTVLPGSDEFTVECKDISASDKELLQDFLWRMRGRSGEFSFEFADVVHPKCRFASDWVDFATNGPNIYSVALRIKILR